MRLFLILSILTGAAAHIVFNLRYAYASFLAQQDTPAALRRAIQLAPADASNYARLAALDPDRRTQWLDAAVARNPIYSLFWIERGVTAEVAGNPSAAEASLLQAARIDHLYIPRWTLAAFYYRQRDVPKFRTWARQALDMAWGDALPLFQMAAQLGMPSDEIRRTMLPDRAPVLTAFLSESLRLKDLDESVRTTRRLIQIGKPEENRTAVLAAVDALFESGRTAASVELWNQAAAAHWFQHPAIGPPVTNPDFSLEFLPAGFDWRVSVPDGIVYWRLGNGRGLQFELSGRQPENCTLLTLNLPIEPGKPYKIDTKAAGFKPGSGLKWRLGTQEWDVLGPRQTIQIESPPAHLTLIYERVLGTKRISGTLDLLRVDVTP